MSVDELQKQLDQIRKDEKFRGSGEIEEGYIETPSGRKAKTVVWTSKKELHKLGFIGGDYQSIRKRLSERLTVKGTLRKEVKK